MADEGYTRANVATEKSKAVNLDSYVFDLGEHPVPDRNKTKFRDVYSASGREYSGHTFKTTIDGKEHTITIPNRVAREVHISAETERHPITFNQKLQPNYITGNRNKGPSYVGRLKVQSICYFNSIQSQLQLPNFFRQKAWAIQKEIFTNKLQFKDVGKPGNPAIMDLDYSKQVLQHMKTVILPKQKRASQKLKVQCGGSRILEDPEIFKKLVSMLPNIDAFVNDDSDEEEYDSSSDEMSDETEQEVVAKENEKRVRKGKVKKKGLTKPHKKKILKKKKEDEDEGTSVGRMATRSSPMKETLPESDKPSLTNRRVKRRLEDDATKLRLDNTAVTWAAEGNLEQVHTIEDLLDEEGDEDVSTGDAFDLFEDVAVKPKIPWENHPEMSQLIQGGRAKIELLGFKSPKSGAKTSTTMVSLARMHNVELPSKRADAEKTLIRALAIKRLLSKEPKLQDEYE